MLEEIEMLDFEDLLQEQSSKQISRFFQTKMKNGFKITIFMKRALNFPLIQTKKNNLFSKFHNAMTIVRNKFINIQNDQVDTKVNYEKQQSHSQSLNEENRSNNTQLSLSCFSKSGDLPILPAQQQTKSIAQEVKEIKQHNHENISTSNEENTSEQEHPADQSIHPLRIKLNLSLKNFKNGHYSRAIDMIKDIYQEAFNLQAVQSDQLHKFYILICVQSLCYQAIIYKQCGQFEEANKQFLMFINYYWCLERCLKQFEINDLQTIAKIYFEISINSMQQAKFLKANEFLKYSIVIYEILNWKLEIAKSLTYLAISLAHLQSFEDSKKLIFEALSIYKHKLSNNDIQIFELYHSLGQIYYLSKEYDVALEYLDQSLEGKQKIFGDLHKSMIRTLNLMGIISQLQGLTDDAIQFYQRAIIIYNGEACLGMAQILNNLGLAYIEKMKITSAKLSFEKSYQIFSEYYSENHPKLIKILKNTKILQK